MALDRIGRYEIVGPLGKGAMGIVYKATDPTIGRTVALKTMRLDIQGPESTEMLARFRNEARLAGVLNHPNIVTVYDAGEINGLFYMAMEYIEGRTLYQLLLQERVLTMDKVLDIARQICAGLDAASALRVVHRDIKPANIMSLPSGLVKIMDFGIAKCGGSMTSTGEVLGTPNYMSPEQVKGKVLDGRSDLFSFGVILYEMITGEKPFTGDNITTIIYKIVNEEPIPPRELNPNIHPGLNRVMLRALAKNPQDRYQLGIDLVRALESYETMTEAELETPRSIPEAVFNFPQAVASTATKKSAAPAASPARTRNGAGGTARIVTKVMRRKPLIARRSISRLPVVAGILTAVIVVVSGVIVYLKHEQRKHEAEMQQVVQQNNPEPAPEIGSSTQPQPAVAAPETSVSSASQIPADVSPAEPARPRDSRKVRNQRPPHVAALAAAPASAAMTLGEMVLSSEPDDAAVTIDGNNQPAWRTPFTATAVSPGAHTVIFAKSGYVSETRTVEVKPGQPAFLRLAMKAVTTMASIKSEPEGAAIIIDEKEISKVTPAEVNLTPGEHSIAVRKSGFQEASTDVDLGEGQPYTFSPVLKPLDLAQAKEKHGNVLSYLFGGGGGRVAVEMHTIPRGAEILVNGELYSKTTPTKLALEPGEYEITFRLQGYRVLRKNLTVGKGPAIRIEETLQR